jgi:hypothetical protein
LATYVHTTDHVADEAGNDAAVDELAQLPFVVRAGDGADRHLSARAVVHAPAATHDRPAGEVEQRLEIGPGLWRERSRLKVISHDGNGSQN